ncbi:serine/threonine-protein phosphatase [Streptomyces sp. SW4]|nr:serine/threonine-protein phosphatase [Streptomyces sp. SW4]
MNHLRARASRRLLALGLPTVWGATAVTYNLACPLARQDGLGARIVTSAVFFAVGTGLVLHVRRTLLRELRQARRVAGAAQRLLLRPLPPRVGGLDVAAVQLSADPGAQIGGDLYDVVGTEHGVRVVMGDVRGHGLGAAGTAAAVLGSFREAVHDEPCLGGVLRRLERAHARYLREAAGGTAVEDFVTVLLLEIRPDGAVRALNCGHPWPYLLHGTRIEPLGRADPLPPLGLVPLPADLADVPCGTLRPGEALFLHTDGAEDARDAQGRFFPLPEALADAARAEPGSPAAVLHRTLTALLHHTRGAPGDDIALLMLADDGAGRGPGAARPATTHPGPTGRRSSTARGPRHDRRASCRPSGHGVSGRQPDGRL